jgi:hypothetical protein
MKKRIAAEEAAAIVVAIGIVVTVAAAATSYFSAVTAGTPTTSTDIIQSAEALVSEEPWFAKAPTIVSGDNIYIAWWNGTAGLPDVQTDVMFRASSDSGATFSDKINLSNTTDADSGLVEIAGEGDNVIVSWWERNQTSNIPVARVSNDAGATFGPMLRLATNGTIGSTEEEGGEAVEEEAVGGAEVAE